MVKFWQVSNITVKSSYRRRSIKKAVLKNFSILIGKHRFSSRQLYYKETPTQCFPANIAKFLRISILKNICERLLLIWLIRNRLFRDVFTDDNQRVLFKFQWNIYDEAFVKTVDLFNSWLFLQNTSYYLFHTVMNMPW